jgi:hypothetical protein
MNPRSKSVTSRLRILPTMFALAVLPTAAIHLSSDAISSTSASNRTINIGTHPPNAPLGAADRFNPDVPQTLIIKG